MSAEPTVGLTFGRVAEAYARTRPPYAPAAIERAALALGLTSNATVLDLAAGTGNLTRALRTVFAHVVAVEPDDGMRAQFDGEVLAGTAEAIPLPDAAVDAVFVGEAFHWFDPERALAEIRRVGRGLAILARSWGETEQPGLLPPPFWAELDAVWRRFHAGTRDDFRDWREIVRPEGPERFVEVVPISGRDLVDLHLTSSTPASIPAGERAAIADRAYPLMDAEYELRVVTELYWTRFDTATG
ncbi:MAG: class I SAM-dependent methyltransferase [Gaiellaceae bacterium]